MVQRQTGMRCLGSRGWKGISILYHDPLSGSLSFLDSSVGKESACNAGDPSSIPGLGRSPGEGKGYPLQYSGLENSMNFITKGVPKSQDGTGQLSLREICEGINYYYLLLNWHIFIKGLLYGKHSSMRYLVIINLDKTGIVYSCLHGACSPVNMTWNKQTNVNM